MSVFGAAEFSAATNVSRETLARLETYADLLRKWQAAINLVGPATLPDLWRRHMLDSWQLLDLLPPGCRTLVDLGSGAGFPGLVLAILGVPAVHLIESDTRKCAFMAEVARATGVTVQLHRTRIEAAPPVAADAVTARALAPLDRLLDWATRFRTAGTTLLFLKGQDVERELTEATISWKLDLERIASRSDPRGCVLRITGFTRES